MRPKGCCPAKDVAELSGPQQPEEDDKCSYRHGCGPIRPLAQVRIPHVLGVYAKDACHRAQREEYDRDDRERVNRAFLAVPGCLDLVLILHLLSVIALKARVVED